MKKIATSVFLILCFTLRTVAQENFEFPKDPITKKFSIDEVIDVQGKVKNDLVQAIKNVTAQLIQGSFDKRENDELNKQFTVSSYYNGSADTTRLLYKVQIIKVSTKGLKLHGYKSYIALFMDMTIYVKDGKYKIELTNFTVSGPDIKISGSAESIEEKNSSNKNWDTMKKEIFNDATYVKNKIKENIQVYFKKSDF